jgi:uncharacterized membrane protein YebE (DUF533 family)
LLEGSIGAALDPVSQGATICGEIVMFDAKALWNALLGKKPSPHAEAVAEVAKDSLERGKQAASDIANQTSGAVSGALERAQEKLQGTAATEYIERAREIIEKNPAGTTAALGGLAAILLGTKGGREATMGAVKLGGLAAIGGLAYKAYRNYQDGRPLTEGVPGFEQIAAAPSDSEFAADKLTNESALLLIRAMIATAAADGVVDPSERGAIIGELKQTGIDAQAAEFLDAEIAHPASIEDIAKGVGSSKELAVQVYTAAQLVASSEAEERFLTSLGQALALDPNLVARVDQAARAYVTTTH